jgi:hypothetical protein
VPFAHIILYSQRSRVNWREIFRRMGGSVWTQLWSGGSVKKVLRDTPGGHSWIVYMSSPLIVELTQREVDVP